MGRGTALRTVDARPDLPMRRFTELEVTFVGSETRPAFDPYADIETMRSFDVKGAPALEE